MAMTTRFMRAALVGGTLVLPATPGAAQQAAKNLAQQAINQQAPAQPPANATPAAASAPASGAPAAPVDPATAKKEFPTPPSNFEYSPQGRRDPFVSLVARGNEGGGNTGEATKVRAEGVPGIMTGELFVRGIMQSRGAWVAMVAGADKKIYTVRAGDKLADGVIRQITANSVVILQEVNDPLSLEKQREVRKFLRGGEEVK